MRRGLRILWNLLALASLALCAAAAWLWSISANHSYALRCMVNPDPTERIVDGKREVTYYVFEFERCVFHARGGQLSGQFSADPDLVLRQNQWRLYTDAGLDQTVDVSSWQPPPTWFPPWASLPEGSGLASFAHERHARGRGQTWRVSVRRWLLVVAFALLPAARVATFAARLARRRRRAARGNCRECGYDLRAIPGRCPECGAASDPRAG